MEPEQTLWSGEPLGPRTYNGITDLLFTAEVGGEERTRLLLHPLTATTSAKTSSASTGRGATVQVLNAAPPCSGHSDPLKGPDSNSTPGGHGHPHIGALNQSPPGVSFQARIRRAALRRTICRARSVLPCAVASVSGFDSGVNIQ
ncbi:unnamed protein product [Boreogadus saida]